MTEDSERLIGQIDERTKAIQGGVTDIKDNVRDLFSRLNSLRSQMDTLQAEHNDRKMIDLSCQTQAQEKVKYSPKQLTAITLPPSTAALVWALVELVKAWKGV